ncbi:MAG: hypothetical protein HY047_20555 [Acidobacteria bacterium]|nr:hypothetical protein [Acidobacteriota bacterium]
MRRLIAFLVSILAILYELAIGWLFGFLRLICELRKKAKHKDRVHAAGHVFTRCQVIPPDIYKRPDPLIYSQSYLMSLGLAVTWDNPDIHLYAIGPPPGNARTPIASNALQPDTTYDVRARIYNGSNEAPAIGMAVDFSYLSFGIGTTSTPIGTTVVDLPVRGAPGHPVTASMLWRTPVVRGHYCLQVKLNWADDANPNNNLGQENTDVGAAQSPAVFEFPVRNPNVIPEKIELVADGYVMPDPVDCGQIVKELSGKDLRRYSNADQRKDAMRRMCDGIARRHERERHPVPAGWTVVIDPNQLGLEPGESRRIRVTITPPDSFQGVRAVNINALDARRRLIGGVTLYVRR